MDMYLVGFHKSDGELRLKRERWGGRGLGGGGAGRGGGWAGATERQEGGGGRRWHLRQGGRLRGPSSTMRSTLPASTGLLYAGAAVHPGPSQPIAPPPASLTPPTAAPAGDLCKAQLDAFVDAASLGKDQYCRSAIMNVSNADEKTRGKLAGYGVDLDALDQEPCKVQVGEGGGCDDDEDAWALLLPSVCCVSSSGGARRAGLIAVRAGVGRGSGGGPSVP
jgi:hypothetical protein